MTGPKSRAPRPIPWMMGLVLLSAALLIAQSMIAWRDRRILREREQMMSQMLREFDRMRENNRKRELILHDMFKVHSELAEMLRARETTKPQPIDAPPTD